MYAIEYLSFDIRPLVAAERHPRSDHRVLGVCVLFPKLHATTIRMILFCRDWLF
eukprot:m.1688154 g.1688154  ORF g.1688154 m.1688154 type:complete len:54 (+) comp360521_c0_seq1:21-182(+)